MPIRKVINRLLLRSQECSDWFDESGQTDSSAYRTKDHVLFFSNTRSRTFFFFRPPNRWPTSKKSDHKWRIDGTTSGLINSVTALHGRVSFRSAICHVPKGTYKQNEAVSTQFMHDPRTRFISFYFACLIWSLELLYRYFFFCKILLKKFYSKDIYIYIYLRNNYQQRLQRKWRLLWVQQARHSRIYSMKVEN